MEENDCKIFCGAPTVTPTAGYVRRKTGLNLMNFRLKIKMEFNYELLLVTFIVGFGFSWQRQFLSMV